uniref:Transcription and mRNA export factor ENY2 n=1 Tax=Saimiri boliviensis boliviensis TaxID=39432 RepID=A0A2K6TS46_SAIBB
MNKDAQMRAAINQKLIETGERERLKELLRAKLIECGWKDQLKAHCKEVIKEKGLEHVTVDDLVAEITPKGRGKEYRCGFTMLPRLVLNSQGQAVLLPQPSRLL